MGAASDSELIAARFSGVWRLCWVKHNAVWSKRGSGMGELVVGVSADLADRVLRGGASEWAGR